MPSQLADQLAGNGFIDIRVNQLTIRRSEFVWQICRPADCGFSLQLRQQCLNGFQRFAVVDRIHIVRRLNGTIQIGGS